MEHTICHFEIPVDDPQAAMRFYGSLFGWSIGPGARESADYLFVRTAAQPEALGGALLRRAGPEHGVTLYVAVESVDEHLAKVVELGGTVVQPKTALPSLGWAAVARDPQGIAFGLFEEDREAR